MRANYKIELPEEFIRIKREENDFHQFIELFISAFNRLPEADRQLLSYKYLRKNQRNNYGGRGSCNAFRAAAELGLSVRNFYTRRNKSLEKLATSLRINKIDF